LSDFSSICQNLKCLELTKCKEFYGDGLQELIEQAKWLETLQLGKFIYPTFNELNEINWSSMKTQLKELTISTKFPVIENMESLSPRSNTSGSSNSSLNIDLYSKTLFNYLNDDNQLEYLALEDFTLKFPIQTVETNHRDSDETKSKKLKATLNTNLKYACLRNIRDVKLHHDQAFRMKTFLELQYNLTTLDLIGIYLGSEFICSILCNLNNLKVFNFGHGKSCKRSIKFLQSDRHFDEFNASHSIDIDAINSTLANFCVNLTHLGIFHRQSELRFKRDASIEFKNDELFKLLISCKYMNQISYLKSFKLKDDDDNNECIEESSSVNKNYFHFIRYAIQNTSTHSTHVDMKPCYGSDLTPSAQYLLEPNGDFIEPNLPLIQPPVNDFHFNLLNV